MFNSIVTVLKGPKVFVCFTTTSRKTQKFENISIDVGQIIFGQTVTTSGDTMKQHIIEITQIQKVVMGDIECTAGCGVFPLNTKRTAL